jgi:hypothetical protein
MEAAFESDEGVDFIASSHSHAWSCEAQPDEVTNNRIDNKRAAGRKGMVEVASPSVYQR